MQQFDHSHPRKQFLTFASITTLGIAALLLGLALILFAHYHERAYIFLGLGAGGIIGGIAGIVGAGSKTGTALSYGMIALGMMGTVIGINYLTNYYGPSPNQAHGEIVIALSLITILGGFVGAVFVQPTGGIATFLSVIMLGVVASLGIVVVTIGTIYLLVLQSQERAYLLLSVGAICFIGGIFCGTFIQSRARNTLL